MKKLAIVAAAVLALGSVAAYAQMRQHGSGHATQAQQHGEMGPGMMQRMHQAMMHGGGMQHGQMPHGQMQQGGHGGHGGVAAGHGTGHGAGHAAAGPKGDTGPSSLAFHAINAKMHAGMDIAFTGNADVDFVRGMIPHHEGAVDMAKTVLAFGKDPEIRKLAEDIVNAQESEIAQMKAWLAKNAAATANAPATR